MIFDSLNECEKYYLVNPRFKSAFEFILKACEENLGVGKYIIEEGKLFASIQEYESKTEDKCKFEAHRKFIDIQFILYGKEIMQTLQNKFAVALCEYKEDVQFFANTELFSSAEVYQNQFGIFFPSDIHRSGIKVHESEYVKKIVVKVSVD